MDWENMLLLFLVLIFSLTVHEAAHGLFAWIGGDRTAKDRGLVTLNPIPHMRREPIGMVLIPIVILYLSAAQMCFGGASAPIDPYWATRHPKKAALMSAAGPLANLLLAGIAFVALYYHGSPAKPPELPFRILLTVLQINLLLGIFNLLPLPPFDGAGVLGGLVPAAERLFRSFTKVPFYSIVSMVVAWLLLPHTFWPTYRWLISELPYYIR